MNRTRYAPTDLLQFDPKRAQNHAQVDLADPGERTVEPFYAPGVASTAASSPDMAQYPRSAATASEGNYGAQDLSRMTSSATSAGFAGRGAGAYPQGYPAAAEPMPTIPAGAAYAAGAGAIAGGAMSAKQREAFQERQRLTVANHAGAGYSGAGSEPMSPTGTSRSGPVTVHEDAGSAGDTEEGPALGAEIPPT